MFNRSRLSGLFIACLSLAAGTGCPAETEDLSSLLLKATPRTIRPDGEKATIDVEALTTAGAAGTGDVLLSAEAGKFDNGQAEVTLTLAAGKASTGWSCDVATAADCTGRVRITGTWTTITSSTTVTLVADAGTGTTDAGGTTDGGNGDGGSADGGDGGTGGGPVFDAGATAGLSFEEIQRDRIGIISSGRETTTDLTFKVVNEIGFPKEGVTVTFTKTSGPADFSVTPSDVTDAEGLAIATVRAGDSVGTANIRATITLTTAAGGTRSVNSPGIAIVGAVPSDRGFTVQCDRLNLGALHNIVPGIPRPTETNCVAALADRFSNRVELPTPVRWFSEAGSIQPVSQSDEVGLAVATFSTRNLPFPEDVIPFGGEPDSGTHNPRDGFSSIIAIVSGEESFIDGSGGRPLDSVWQPGEWYTDLGEPFVDNNDDNVWQPGEQFFDTERPECDGGVSAPNGTYDGPNGCWDRNTQIWRTTHIIYSGPADRFQFRGALPTVPNGGVRVVLFDWTDENFNRMSNDGLEFSATTSAPKNGRCEISNGPFSDVGAEGYGHDFIVEDVAATETAPGVFNVLGPCTGRDPAPANPAVTRCIRRTTFNGWDNGNFGSIQIVSTADAGTGGPQGFSIGANHTFSLTQSVSDFVDCQ